MGTVDDFINGLADGFGPPYSRETHVEHGDAGYVLRVEVGEGHDPDALLRTAADVARRHLSDRDANPLWWPPGVERGALTFAYRVPASREALLRSVFPEVAGRIEFRNVEFKEEFSHPPREGDGATMTLTVAAGDEELTRTVPVPVAEHPEMIRRLKGH